MPSVFTQVRIYYKAFIPSRKSLQDQKAAVLCFHVEDWLVSGSCSIYNQRAKYKSAFKTDAGWLWNEKKSNNTRLIVLMWTTYEWFQIEWVLRLIMNVFLYNRYIHLSIYFNVNYLIGKEWYIKTGFVCVFRPSTKASPVMIALPFQHA